MDAVGGAELLVPGLDEAPIPAEHHHLVAAPVEQVDVVVLIDRYAGHLVELVAFRQSSPVLGQLIRVVAAPVGHLSVTSNVVCTRWVIYAVANRRSTPRPAR